MTYLYQVIIDFLILALLAGSMDLLLGSGLLLVSQAISCGLGAYAAALCTTKLNLGFLTASAIGACAAALANLLIALPARKLRGDAFVMTSLAFQVSLYAVIYNAVGLTGGPYGLAGIPKPQIAGFQASTSSRVAVLYAIIVLSCMFAVFLLRKSGFGRSLTAIREDEMSAKSLGIPVARRKTEALLIAAALAGIAGSLYAHQASYLDPTSFTLDTSILVVSVCVVGGIGRAAGPLTGALTLTLIQEVLRLLDFPSATAGALRLLIYGLLVLWMVLKRPQGLAGLYRFH